MSFRKALKTKIKTVPKETQQKILDLIHAGKSVGEVCREVNLELLVVSAIVHKHVERIGKLKKVAQDDAGGFAHIFGRDSVGN